MLIYWIMYLIPAALAVIIVRKNQSDLFLLFCMGFIFCLIIGLRHNIGSDWGAYLGHITEIKTIPFFTILEKGDYGHIITNWIMAKLNLGIYGVNFMYAIIFMIGLIKFCKPEQNHWIGITVAVPYLMIVVAMSLSKQSAALGFLLLGLSYLKNNKVKSYVLSVFFGALFHNSVIIMLFLLVFNKNIKKQVRYIMIILTIPVLYIFLSQNYAEFFNNYISRGLKSSGIYARLFLNLIPIFFLFIYRKKWKKNFDDYNIWYWFSFVSIVSIFFIPISSTLIDRILIYFIPLQLVVYSRLPFLNKDTIQPIYTKLAIIIFYAIVNFVWLNYSKHSPAWLPYKNILF